MKSKAILKAQISLLILFATFMPWQVMAQAKIQVVTKTITRKLDCNKDTQLRITGEKAKVNVKGWDKNYISVTIRLIGKHPEREVAESELEHLKFYIKESGNVHDLGNYFLVEKNDNPIKANLLAEYEVSVPESLPVIISCKFGDVNMENTKGNSEIDLEYGKLTLNNVGGEMKVRSVFGDVKSLNSNLTLKCTAEKANLDFDNAAGSYQIANVYGQIRLSSADALRNVNIQSSRTSVTLLTKNFEGYNYDLATSYGELALPAQANSQTKQSSGGKNTYKRVAGKNMPTIKVLTTYSPITIQSQVN